jgi:glycosyltransferase involved in cell wall biosynthesis
MNTLLVNHKDTADINAFSGISYFMSHAIKRRFEHVTEFNDLEPDHMSSLMLDGLFKKSLKPFSDRLSNFLRSSKEKFDFIICQGGNTCIPFYKENIPIVYWHDSSWNSIWRNYLDNSSYLDKKAFQNFKSKFYYLYKWDKRAMERADLIIFSSEYTAEACKQNYGIFDNKVHVIPFGANLKQAKDSGFIKAKLAEKLNSETINLTFFGKDWQRKGLSSAYKLTCKLNSIGIKTKLTIIGCYPTIQFNKDFVHVIGYIDKSKTAHLNILEDVLESTHFLIHPAISEPFGIVLCEANAYGIPVIGTDIDGLKTIIRSDKNGYLFRKGKFINDASKKIDFIVSDFNNQYSRLAYGAFDEFEKRLNWDTSVNKLYNLLNEKI